MSLLQICLNSSRLLTPPYKAAYGRVVQTVESVTHNHDVAGSSPAPARAQD